MFEKLKNLKLFQNSKFKIKNLLEYGLYVFVFLLPWQTKLILRPGVLNRGIWDYGTIALYGTDILLVGLLIVAFILSLRAKANNPQLLSKNNNDIKTAVTHPAFQAPLLGRGILVILSGLSFFLFVSVFFAPDKVLAFYRYFIFLLGLGFFWLIVKVEYNKTKMAIVFLSGLIIQGVFAVQQFLNQGTPAFKWLGLAAHSPADLGVSVIETVGVGGVPERWLRAYGSLDHPNILGGLMAIGLIIIISVIVNHQRINNKKTDWKFITYNLSFIILSAGLIFSFSRSALVSFAFGLIVFFIFYFIKKDWPTLKKIGSVAVLFVVLLSLIFINYQNLFYTRAGTSARLEAKSFSERKMYLDDSFSLIKNNWLFGVGIGNYTKALSEKDLHRPWYYLQPVHNVFLLVWAEAGIFSLLFFIALLFYLFWQAIKKNNVLGLSVLGILAIIMIFDHYLWSLHFGILFFWLLIGFLFSSEREK